MYVDDAVIFTNHVLHEIEALLAILHQFEEASGLRINRAKSTASPICCDNINIEEIMANFGGHLAAFPIRYLGLPITLSRTKLVHLRFGSNQGSAGWLERQAHEHRRTPCPRACCAQRNTHFCHDSLTDAEENFQGNRQGTAIVSLGSGRGAYRRQMQGQLG